MATVDLTQIGDFLVKNGAKGVLLVWVFMLQLQVNEFKQDYKDCMNDRIIDRNSGYGYNLQYYAILPERINVKKHLAETGEDTRLS